MSHQQAARYRWRAAHLRTLSHQMTTASAMSIQRHAGASTWHGPRAQSCLHALAGAQRGVYRAADDLADQAWRFDRLADEHEAAALRAERQLAV